MKYYYERSGILDSPINITYHEVFQMNNADLVKWIDLVRKYIVKEWDEKGIPPTIGQNTDEIIDSFRKLRDYKVRDFIEDNEGIHQNISTIVSQLEKNDRVVKSKSYVCLVIEMIFRISQETSKKNVFLPYDLYLLK